MIDDPDAVTQDDMDRWAADFDSWDVCDQVCGNLFDRTPFASAKAFAWSDREPEFMKRAAFSLMACLAAHRDVRDAELASFLPVIEREATDDRNAVKKGVIWALRQIGKRSPGLIGMGILLNITQHATSMESGGRVRREAHTSADPLGVAG